MNNKIEMIKLYNGDYIIGERQEVSPGMYQTTVVDAVVLLNPRAFVFMPVGGGQVNAGFQPICVFSKASRKSIRIPLSQIMVTIPNEDIPKEVINGYQSDVSGIEIATASDVSAINSSKNEFSI